MMMMMLMMMMMMKTNSMLEFRLNIIHYHSLQKAELILI